MAKNKGRQAKKTGLILNDHYTYFLILAASLAGPLLLSFDKKVAFYKKWKYVFPALVLPALFYIAWDLYFTSMGVWSFNDAYITGIKLYNLPVEEVLFFFVVPYCCVFIYECIRSYFPGLQNREIASAILKLLGLVLLIIGLIFYDKWYTFSSFTCTAVCIAVLFIFRKYFSAFNVTAFLIAYIIVLIPFLIVNGILTAIPVVLYNNAENLNMRIYTIPVEDCVYGMLLLLMNIAGFEKLRNNR